MSLVIPAWLKVVAPLALLALIGLLCAWAGSTHTDRQWQLKWSQRDAADLKAAKAFTESQRRIELQRQGDIDAIQSDAEKRLAVARSNAARAAAESERLRTDISTAIARLQSGGSDSGTPAISATGASDRRLLAELFGEIDTAAGEYAAEADRRGEAGLTCERAYDAMRSRTEVVKEIKK